MNRNFKHKHRILLVALIALIWTSCKVDKVLPVAESVKDISGSWKVLKASRNGTDLTGLTDFTQFRVKFDASGGYTLVNPLPFVVNKDGKFNLDDPNYPFKLTFTPTGGQPLGIVFNYPIVGGARQLNLTFSPGCSLNTYIYTLVKE
jgi:hypothetical protein